MAEGIAPTDALIAAARGTPLVRGAVALLAERLDDVSVEAVVREALRRDELRAAHVLLGAAVCDERRRLEEDFLAEVLPDVSALSLLRSLVWSAPEPLRLVLRLLDEGRMAGTFRAPLFYWAPDLPGAREPWWPRLVHHLKVLARGPCAPRDATLFGLALGRYEESDVLDAGRQLLASSARADVADARRALQRHLARDFRDELPEEATRGRAVRPGGKRVGRNEPCPCGSGQKYKRCCEDERGAPTPEGFVEPGSAAIETRLQELSQVPVGRLVRLDPKRLKTALLLPLFEHLAAMRRWPEAERAAEELQRRDDVPATGWNPERHPEGYWYFLASQALDARDLARAEQFSARIQGDTGEDHWLHVGLHLLRGGGPAVEWIERHASDYLRNDRFDYGLSLTNALSRQMPALSILVGMSCLRPDRPEETEMVLRSLAQARDRLGLTGEGVLEQAYERLVRAHTHERLERAAAARDLEERERLQRTVEELRRRSREAAERAEEFQRTLRARERELKELEAKTGLPGAQPGEPDESKRLRVRIQELKSLVSAGVAERSALRREMLDLAGTAARDAVPPTGEPVDDGEEGGTGDEEGPVQPLVPRFSKAAADGLREVPGPAGREAVRLAGLLAAGEPAAWAGVKRLAFPRDLLSVRLGIHHRMLLRRTAEELEVVEVVPRKELDRAIARHR